MNDKTTKSSTTTTSLNDSFKKDVEYHLKKTLGLGLRGVTTVDEAAEKRLFLHLYKAIALAIRDKIIDKWISTNREYRKKEAKQLYYLSAEYLPGRFLANNIINLGAQGEIDSLLNSLGLNLNEIEDMEMDAGLGSGGLGRLAACF
ncbi:MAG: glycogen/starch/alpha-glucan phosphorylase [Candidatus Scalindua sp.]|nr:glycogen/starch/alpha-glucan phosphorylase [Candidatus Scalindua sp.]